MTDTIVRTIRASGRILRSVLARLLVLGREGSVMEWLDDDALSEIDHTTAPMPIPTLRDHLRAKKTPHSTPLPTPDNGLRLITPRSRRNSADSFETPPTDRRGRGPTTLP